MDIVLTIIVVFSAVSMVTFTTGAGCHDNRRLATLSTCDPSNTMAELSARREVSIMFSFLSIALTTTGVGVNRIFDINSLGLGVSLHSIGTLYKAVSGIGSLLGDKTIGLLDNLLNVIGGTGLGG